MIYYVCPGIKVLTAFSTRIFLTVQVVVGNWQGGDSTCCAMVAVWWSPPLSGSTIPDPQKFIGFASVALPLTAPGDDSHHHGLHPRQRSPAYLSAGQGMA